MRRRGVLLTIVGPWGRAVIPVIIGNEAVVLGNGLSLRFPEPDVREGAMHEDDRSACPLFDVGQLHAVDTQLARRRWGFRARLSVNGVERSEEHTSEPQSQSKLVCRLLLEKKKK